MLESRLIEHLKVLNAQESLDFLRYAKAMAEYEKDIPEDTLLLVKYLTKHIKDEDKLIKKTVYKNIFPKETWKDGRLEKLMSYALRLFKNYILFKNYSNENAEINEGLALAIFYRKNVNHKLFELNNKLLQKLNENIELPNNNDFLNHFLIEKETFIYKSENNTRRENLNLPETIFALDTFYLIERLELILISLAQNQFIPFDSGENVSTLDYVVALANHQAYRENIVIQLFIKAIQLQTSNDKAKSDDIFKFLVVAIEKNIEKINSNAISLFGTIVRNYCVRQYSQGRKEFLAYSFDIFKFQLEAGLLYKNNKITAATMQNIIINAAKLKKYDFVKQFLIEHKDKITGTQQPELVWQYNMSLYYFEIGDFQEAQATLPNYLDLDDTFYTLAARRVEIKILFETENNSKYDILGNKIDAFKNYLYESKKNNRIAEHIININNNFIDLLKQIRSTIKKDKERIEKLLQKLEESNAIAEREWLQEKLEALKM
jgi:hypothetical protein